MPRVTRRRVVDAPASAVWKLVSDPYSLPRWWPRTTRVEGVEEVPGGRRSRWTKVLETAQGRGVRADYRCVSAAVGERYVWEQELAGTPFERHLRSSSVDIRLLPDGHRTEVVLTAIQSLRGLSRLGSPLMRRAQRDTLEQALAGIAQALGPSG